MNHSVRFYIEKARRAQQLHKQKHAVQLEIPNWGDEMTATTCMACGFESELGEMVVAHQAICPNLDEEKREYREAVLHLMFRTEDIPRVLDLAKTATDEWYLKHPPERVPFVL